MRFGTAPASAGAFLWVDIAGRDLGADCYGRLVGRLFVGNVDVEVDPLTGRKLLGVRLDPVERHSEPQRDAVAGEVACGAANLDAPHAELPESDVPERADGGGDDTPVLVLLAKPITDFDGAGDGVGGLEPDEPGEKSVGADGIDGVGGIGERGPDECAGILLAQSEGDERQPQSEVRTLGVDGAENIGCVAGLQGPERVRIEKGDHGEDF